MTDFQPTPDPSGRREPPRRKPPTAIGLLTPPRPPRRPSTHTYRSSLRTRLAQGFVGFVAVGVGSTVATLASGVLGVVIGSAIALAGAPLIVASTRSEHHRVSRFFSPSEGKRRRAA